MALHDGRYIPRKVIGTGTYGQVLCCRDSLTNKDVAVKIAHQAPAYRRSAINESNVLRMLQGQCSVVNVLETFEEDDRIHITTELLYKNLYEVICDRGYKGFSLNEIQSIAKSVLTVLSRLHAIGYMHCDVKPENAMLTYSNTLEVKMIDFGSVRKLEENAYFDVQSLWYRAPEVICGLEYTPLIDAWSAGCLFAELCTGSPLFPGDSPQQQLTIIIESLGLPSQDAVLCGKYSSSLDFNTRIIGGFDEKFTRYIGNSDEAQMFLDFLLGLLNPDETYRFSVDDALEHPFITRRGWFGRGHYRSRRHSSPSINGSIYGMSESTTSTPDRVELNLPSPMLFHQAAHQGPLPIGEDL
jgi:serine/threonine protein kinase